MSIQFILGKPGTGKTTLCLTEIGHMLDSGAPLYYLVPEQFSLQAERLFLANRPAATQVQVLSFNRLAHRLFAAFGGAPNKMVDDLGREMLIRKVLLDIQGESQPLTYYQSAVDKQGFVGTVASTLTEMRHYRVTPDTLAARAQGSSPAFAAKMEDIARIARGYRALVGDKYLLTDDMLDILCQQLDGLKNSPIPLLDGAYFWVDGFSGFTPQERQVLLHLMKRSKKVSFTLTTACDPRLTPPYVTLEKLQDLAAAAHIQPLPQRHMKENFRHTKAKGLAALVDHFTVHPNKDTAPHHDGIHLVAAKNRYAAVYNAASHILTWVQDKGYDFRDIAILCGDRKHYEKILHTTFQRLNIPLFVDTEIDILSHPLTELIRAALEMIVRQCSLESVFRMLKTRLTGLDMGVIDILENYALAHGISSYRWGYPFHNPEAEAAREQLLAVFATFMEDKPRGHTTATVKDHCTRIFNMLYALNIPKTLDTWHESHTAMGDHATARLHKQIWPKICDIFDKLVEMLGNDRMTIKQFAATLDAGFNQVGLGRLPPTTNQVVLGDIGRSRYPEIKAMIVIGANDNVFPAPPGVSGLFTDKERQTLEHTGIELAPQRLHRVTEGYYSIYCALTQPKEALVLIYAQAEPNGRPLRPSPIIGRLQSIFPTLPITQAPDIREYGEDMTLPTHHPTLSQETLDTLYGQTLTTAASRLEAFARCPFAYFVTYILKARPRQEFQVLSSDVGTLFHDILAQYAKAHWEGGAQPVTREDIARHVQDIINALPLADVYQETARNRHVLDKVRRASIASIWALCQHIQQGAFVPTLTEYPIRTQGGLPLDNGKNLVLTGVVDRVDTFTHEGEEYLKIIDYKSGNTKFSIEEANQGVQLQLMIYMNVLMEMRKAKPGGMFYFPIGDPILDTDHTLTADALEAGLLKAFKMSGVALNVESTLEAMDSRLAPGQTSDIIPVAIKKDGQLRKAKTPVVLGLAEFLALGQTTQNIVKSLGTRITSGDVAAKPYTKGSKSPCNFCGFGAICGKETT